MQRLDRYLFLNLLYAFLFAGTAVSVVVLFTQSFRMLSFVIDNSGTTMIFLQLMGLIIPTFLPLIVPLSLGVAVLFAYHKLTLDSEIVVMRASGVAPLRLAFPALALATLTTLLCYVLTTTITPAANRQLVTLQYKVRDDFSVFLIKAGTFNDLAPGLTIFTRARGKNGALEDLLIHDIRQPETPVTIMAESGQFSVVDNQPRIMIFKGKRQELNRANGHLSQLDFDRYVLDLDVLHSGMSSRLPDPREETMAELLNPPADPALRRTTLEHIGAELHQRLASPLLSFSYAMIGLITILAGEFNRRGMTRRLALAALAMVTVQAGMLALASFVGKQIWLAPLLYITALAPALAAFLWLSAPQWRRPKALHPPVQPA